MEIRGLDRIRRYSMFFLKEVYCKLVSRNGQSGVTNDCEGFQARAKFMFHHLLRTDLYKS